MVVTIEPAGLGASFAPGAVGLSIETEELATQDLSSGGKSLVALMRSLGPGNLRVGGNSLDRSWWTSSNERPPAWATNVITPADIVRLRELLARTGWRVVLGIDLGHGSPSRAAAETRIARRILGSRLAGIEIGNEPNGYGTRSIKLRSGTYSAGVYLGELAAYIKAIHATSRGVPLYGPDVAAPTSWLTTIASGTQSPFAVLTEHYYPTMYSVPRGLCKATIVPSALELLTPQVREKENAVLEMLTAAARLAHRPTRISETNTTASCDASGAPDTGPVFASALWSLDWILRAASVGVSGLNFHGYFGPCPPATFSPVCTPVGGEAARGHASARPEFYGIFAARQLEGGRFVPVDIRGQNAPVDVTTYATMHPDGLVTVAVDNFTVGGPTSFILKAPGYNQGTSEMLAAPSISAIGGVTFGGASFDPAGAIRPKQIALSRLDGGFRVELPPTSALVITLHK